MGQTIYHSFFTIKMILDPELLGLYRIRAQLKTETDYSNALVLTFKRASPEKGSLIQSGTKTVVLTLGLGFKMHALSATEAFEETLIGVR